MRRVKLLLALLAILLALLACDAEPEMTQARQDRKFCGTSVACMRSLNP